MRSRSRFPERLGAALLALALAASAAAADFASRVAEGDGLRAEGRLGEALTILEAAAEAAETAPERAWAEGAWGLALAEAGRDGEAETRLRAALEGSAGQPALEAVAAATLARLLAEAQRTETASMRAARLDEAEALASRGAAAARAPEIVAHAAAAHARVALARGEPGEARAILAAALGALGEGGGAGRIQIGDAALAAAAPALAARAYGPERQGAGRGAALAALGLSEAALAEGRWEASLAEAAAARRLASALAMEDVGFSADWLRAEALRRAGRSAEARDAFAAAFEGLRGFRARAPLGAPPATSARRFAPRPFQLDYVDFLLSGPREEGALEAARALIEDLKLDEVDEYFSERCTPARGRIVAAEEIGAGAATLYPVVFEDRTEVIWSLGGRGGAYAVPLGREALRAEVTKLRYLIDLRLGGPPPPAALLYDALIRPVAAELEAGGAKTLVIAPDGPLRALPFAALWDGSTWLGARYGLATILSLGLVEQGEESLAGASALAAGAEAVGQGYVPLASVPLELEAIAALFGADELAGEGFSADALAAGIARRPYDIVHIATHAEFGAEPADNFIVTKDGRLDVTRLEATMRARAVQAGAPVDLLTLSACSTAADVGGEAAERAPLGLAGVGFRSGARSVLASLWPAEDLATARLMTLFYEALAEGAGRAEALRRAQAALIADPATAEPFLWANFLLIGDWR
ncbi:MAG: CHAT domain-containing protein [Pikeienuella sp.]|uniref:CHAT domain-containing protein n=1 Tax=Pikeienuella sp. TaxID=2831957 RepID=UPI0039190ED8